MRVQPYLNFDGRCEEALEFYKGAIGAKVEMLMRMKESPEPPPPDKVVPGTENKVMHASFRIGDDVVMASDGYCMGKADFKGVSLTITVDSPEEADRVFNALGAGGQVQMPLTRTFFSPRFGMLSDRFGLGWMVIVAGQAPSP